MAATTPTVDDQVLDDLDFDPDLPCESGAHQRLGHTGAAEWIVTAQPGCGCRPFHVLSCEDCLSHALNLTEVCLFKHEDCGRYFTASFASTIVSTERIR